MPYNEENLTLIADTGTKKMYEYISSDSALEDNYFNPAHAKLVKDDLILANIDGQKTLLTVTNIDGQNVSVSRLTDTF